MIDACHGWSRNAAQSDIAIGQTHHHGVGLAVVTRQDDPVSQRHGIKGVENLYQHFDENDIHGHDRNASVNKYQHQPQVTNANDMWHANASKGVTKEMKKIASGPQKYMGVTWHPDLSDKVALIKTHIMQ